MAKPILLIDGDILVYASVSAAEAEVEWDEDLWVMWCDLREAQVNFNMKLEALVRDAPGYEPHLCLTEGNNFRYTVDPSYKGNRKKVRKPMGFLAHKEWVKESFTTIIKPDIEADDTMGILGTKPGSDTIIWSGDKDLKQIPGKHLVDGEIVVITEQQADLWFVTQVLTGDQADGYPGCPGVGKVKAAKLLDGFTTVAEAWPKVLKAYEMAELTEDVALRQARLARILRWDDWDGKQQKVNLWNAPL